MDASTRDGQELLDTLRKMGASRLRAVRLRSNRSTIWSITGGGTRLNLHSAFARAPDDVLRDFAVIAEAGGLAGPEARRASRRVSEWPPLAREVARIRAEPRKEGRTSGPCSATPDQLRYLRSMYGYLNRSRFGGRLPSSVPIRLSARMTSRLGHMKPGVIEDHRHVLEIALNLDLMLPANDALRTDTLVHEMAHAADWLIDGEVGHGPTWRRWADRAGCEVRACASGTLHRRLPGTHVRRVPPRPLAARVTAGGSD